MSEEREKYNDTMRKHNVNENLLEHLVLIDSLHLDPANARDGHDVEGIAASLQEFGQRTLLVVNVTGRVLKGNGTLKAAISLGWDSIAVLSVEDGPVEAVRYAIADNYLGDKSHFVLDRVNKLLESVPEPESIPGVDEELLERVRALTQGDDIAEDYSDFDDELDTLDGYEEGDIKITVPAMYREQVVDWLSHGESKTAPGLGKGVMRRCGILE